MNKIFKIIICFAIIMSIQVIKPINVEATMRGTQYGNKDRKPASIYITNSPGLLKVGETYKLKTKVISLGSKGENITVKDDITWKSSDTKIASIDKNGQIKANKKGTVKITATTSNGKETSITVSVINNSAVKNNIKSINITGAKELISVGSELHLNIEADPVDASTREITWSSSETSIATVDKDGVVNTYDKVGVVTITARTNNGVEDQVTINVVKIILNENEINFEEGYSYNFNVKVEIPVSYNDSLQNKLDVIGSNSTLVKNESIKLLDLRDNNEKKVANYEVSISGKRAGETVLNIGLSGMKEDDYEWLDVDIYKSDNSIIPCPEIIYDDTDKSKIKFTIKPDSIIKKYNIMTSQNKKTGSLANWKMFNANVDGEKTFEFSYNDVQAKIIVFNNEGKSRICYSAPFNFNNKSYIISNNQIVPSINYQKKLIQGAKSYVLNRYGTHSYHTGVSEATVNIHTQKNLSGNNYQYTWLENTTNVIGSDASWRLVATLDKDSSQILKTSTDNYNDRQGIILVIDEEGDVIPYYTDIYNAFDFERKEEINGMNVYFERGFSRIEYLIEFLKKVPPKYTLATANIFYLTKDTFDKNVGDAQGLAFYANIIERDGAGDYGRNSVIHEMGHNLDYMYTLVDNRIISNEDIQNLHNKYILEKSNSTGTCDGYKYLRNYSYKENYTNSNGTINGEFWADIIKYTYVDEYYKNDSTDKCGVNQELFNLRDKYLDNIDSHSQIFINRKNQFK